MERSHYKQTSTFLINFFQISFLNVNERNLKKRSEIVFSNGLSVTSCNKKRTGVGW